jgi:hypothetical protein
MTKKLTTTEGNKLIGEFMNASFSYGIPGYYDFDGFVEYVYDSDWSALMPVVEKIENLNNGNSYLYAFEMGKDWCWITTNDFKPETIVAKSVAGNKIQSIWQAVVEFIQWHNQTVEKQTASTNA